MISVIIPANNEAAFIGPCLDSLLRSDVPDIAVPAKKPQVEIIVAANACTDDTVEVANSFQPGASARGWRLVVQDISEPGKLNALNRAEAICEGIIRVYVDADVTVDRRLLGQLHGVLDKPEPAYASGRPIILPGPTFFSRAYSRFWQSLPFMSENVPGCGLFAVNNAGRARWGDFPQIIADDFFVRLKFQPHERHSVPSHYYWPVVIGFTRLVRVRQRQNRGVDQIKAEHASLLENDDTRKLGWRGMLGLFWRDPVGFAAYTSVAVCVRLLPNRSGNAWVRGR